MEKEQKEYYSVRFTVSLKEALKKLADKANRSFNNYVVNVLTDHVKKQK